MIDALAWTAAGLQAAAYALYVLAAARRRVEPSSASWLMWSYGTALVVVLETDQGIDPVLRALPVVCATCSVGVALLCRRRGGAWGWDAVDRAAVGCDLMLTAVYAAVILSAASNLLPHASEHAAKAGLLLLVSASTVISYVPTLRAARRSPRSEHWLPWTVWTAAYLLLLLATLLAEGLSGGALQFWLYPAICVVVNAMVAWYARPGAHAPPVRSPRPGRSVEPRMAPAVRVAGGPKAGEIAGTAAG